MSLFAFSMLVGIACAWMIWLVLWQVSRFKVERGADTPGELHTIALLFRDGRLIDADDAIWPLLSTNKEDSPDWEDVRSALLPLTPDLPVNLPTSPLRVAHSAGPHVLVDVTQNATRITFSPITGHDADWFQARQNEVAVAQLKPALAYSPNPIWLLNADGRVLWGNDAFHDLAQIQDGTDAFAAHVSEMLQQNALQRSHRVSVTHPQTHVTRWFEVSTRTTDAGELHFATAVDAVVQAEEAQRNFVQTLSKTFANLTTGLAIFDRNRRLALFNPALIDLSGLSAEFLSGRPNLFEFFDKLREHQIMPEPKNYDNWRECMAKLVAAASDDRFRETWTLVGGQTFDVTGRPYPDGAIAFLFNDITAEVSLTRGFRTELETMQSAIDAMEDAVAIFNQQGVLTVCNAAYKAQWNVDPDTCLTEATILDATQEWKSAFHPNPIWPELRDFVTSTTERASWDSELRSRDGREVICRIDPICYGSTMIRFSHPTRRRMDDTDTEPLQIVSA
ncbi:PAS-domain containing protein [Marivita hallyeonensis]|uniref:PAS domain-containing protein n=1 Tax=Marivita hallyeonensis TaxID=996342 RepID=A0A1M5U9I4_9RHOB|nr:PAS-domain containing protein [Marivita hallyeonensis]SHH59516.1 PAS domain-containing protein [Marivita hallyeonensis]